MKEVTKELIKNFHLNKYDFMGYRLIKDRCTYHHIVKKCNNGKMTVGNGAPLMPMDHHYLHIIENYEYYMYRYINEIFMAMHKRGEVLQSDYRLISEILHNFEDIHKDDRNSKGRILIRRELFKRDF